MKIKSILIMLTLLGLGFAMGMLASGQIMKKKVSNFAKMRTAEGLENHIFSVINADETQKADLQKIIRPYSIELERIRKENIKIRRPILDSLNMEIERKLTPEQNQKFQKFIKKMKRSNHPKGKNKKVEKK